MNFKKIKLLLSVFILSLFINSSCLACGITIKTETTDYNVAKVHLFSDEQGYSDHIWGKDDLKCSEYQKKIFQKLNGYFLKNNNLIYYFLVQTAKNLREIEVELEICHDQIRFGEVDYQTIRTQYEQLHSQKCLFEKNMLSYLIILYSR